jgi:hypothetical protein
MKYGYDNTIHRTQLLNVEVDKKGNVVSVRLRCMLLPFSVTVVDKARADEMRRAYETDTVFPINAVDVDVDTPDQDGKQLHLLQEAS